MARETLLRLRCTAHDWRVWRQRERWDATIARTPAHLRRVAEAMTTLESVARGESGYIGVSWGKDSCALLLLSIRLGLSWPVCYIRLRPVENPDCHLVRDAWLARYPELAARYHEIVVDCAPKPSTGRYDTNAAYAEGFARCRDLYGERHISGVRAEESSSRRLAVAVHGLGDSDSRTARPLGRWRAADVYALLHDHPLHPAYACSMGGTLERERIRVNNLWGLYGEGHGRREWERRYYRDAIRAIEAAHRAAVAPNPAR